MLMLFLKQQIQILIQPIIDTTTTTTTENFNLTNLETTTNVETTNFETSQIETQTTTENFDLNALNTVETNIDTTNINVDTTTTTQNFDINTLPTITNIESTETFTTDNYQTSEPIITTPIENVVEPTPSFDINSLPVTTDDTTAIEATPTFNITDLPATTTEQTYNTSEFQTVDTNIETNITNLEPQAESYDMVNIVSTNEDYQTTNIIDSTSALATTAAAPEFDINAFTDTADVNFETTSNIESNTFDASAFQTTTETTPVTFESTNIEPSFDINAITTDNAVTSTEGLTSTDYQTTTLPEIQAPIPELNYNEYQTTSTTTTNQYKSTSTEINNIDYNIAQITVPTSTIVTETKTKKDIDKMEFSVVTPLQGNIAKGKNRNLAKVTLMQNYNTSTYRPFERSDNIGVNYGQDNKAMIMPSEYKSSTFNPKPVKF